MEWIVKSELAIAMIVPRPNPTRSCPDEVGPPPDGSGCEPGVHSQADPLASDRLGGSRTRPWFATFPVMPEEDLETSELKEQIDQRLEAHEHGHDHGQGKPASAWLRYLPLSTAMIAVFAAVASLLSGSTRTRRSLTVRERERSTAPVFAAVTASRRALGAMHRKHARLAAGLKLAAGRGPSPPPRLELAPPSRSSASRPTAAAQARWRSRSRCHSASRRCGSNSPSARSPAMISGRYFAEALPSHGLIFDSIAA